MLIHMLPAFHSPLRFTLCLVSKATSHLGIAFIYLVLMLFLPAVFPRPAVFLFCQYVFPHLASLLLFFTLIRFPSFLDIH